MPKGAKSRDIKIKYICATVEVSLLNVKDRNYRIEKVGIWKISGVSWYSGQDDEDGQKRERH